MVGHSAAFLGISILVIITPGPDTALTIRNTLLGGRRSGVFTAFGVAMGQAIWTLAASAGVTALLVASEPAFAVIKFAGATYLVFLGAEAFCAALRSGVSKDGALGDRSARRLAPSVAFLGLRLATEHR